eukprot:Sro177_g077870.2  (263) ;mRNA; f:78647-79435
MGLLSIDSCKSDLGKPENSTSILDFPPVSLSEVTQTLNSLLDMSGVDQETSVMMECLPKLEGRGRLSGGLFRMLGKVVQEHPKHSKQDQLETALELHYTQMLSGLTDMIRNAYQLDDRSPCDNLVKGKKRLPEGLEVLAIASLFGGTVSLSSKRIDIDLLHVGLCSVRRLQGNHNEFVLDEKLGREAILAIAQDEAFASDLFGKVLDFCLPAKGQAMEPPIAAELRNWCQQKKKATVKDFISKCFPTLPSDMPSWIERLPFQ